MPRLPFPHTKARAPRLSRTTTSAARVHYMRHTGRPKRRPRSPITMSPATTARVERSRPLVPNFGELEKVAFQVRQVHRIVNLQSVPVLPGSCTEVASTARNRRPVIGLLATRAHRRICRASQPNHAPAARSRLKHRHRTNLRQTRRLGTSRSLRQRAAKATCIQQASAVRTEGFLM